MSYRIFLSAASTELASYREEVARVLRRKGIDVSEQLHFRLGGATLLEKLNQYIEECDSTIFLIGTRCGSLPTAEHIKVMGDCEWTTRFREDTGATTISYTQWEFLLAKSQNKNAYVFLTDEDFEPDSDHEENDENQALQRSYREWIKTIGQDRATLTSHAQLVEDVLVLPFPDRSKGQPNNLPLTPLDTLFKGREQFMQDLHQRLIQSTQSTDAITNVGNSQRALTVYGYGGFGKTRAAIEYAWRNADDYSALLFLSAETPEALNNNLVRLADVVSNTDLADSTDERRIHEAYAWLQRNTGWLLILDNVDTEEAAVAIKAQLPKLSQGHVLITSRLMQWGAAVDTMDLGVLDLDDATSYLLEATDADRAHNALDTENAQKVAIKTGQLALGLEHAAAWINAQYVGFHDYLSQWEHDEIGILEEFDQNQIDYPHELLITWKLSVDRLGDGPRELLQILSWLSPEALPDSIFQDSMIVCKDRGRKAIAILTKYSLANRTQQGFQIHRLVQASTRYHQLQLVGNHLSALDNSLAWIYEKFKGDPSDFRDWGTLEPLVEHVDTVCEFSYIHNKIGRDHPTSRLLNDLAHLYAAKASYATAEPLMRRALQIDENNFGQKHPYVARDLNNLATLLMDTNQLAEAEMLIRRAVQIDEQCFGKNHPEVAGDLSNLGVLLQLMNQLPEAESSLRRSLQILERCVGTNHPDVAKCLNNLAAVLKETNQLAEAEQMMRRTLQIDEDHFGKVHPEVAIDLNNLAGLLQETNQLNEAETLMRRALQIDDSCLGKDHPNIAYRLNNLATLLMGTNRLPEAESMIHRALQIDEDRLGKDHPNVARDLNNLGAVLVGMNRLSDAEPIMRRSLQVKEHSMGEYHPDVASILTNLALLLHEIDRLSEALQLSHKAVKIYENFRQQTGRVHPNHENAAYGYRMLLAESDPLE